MKISSKYNIYIIALIALLIGFLLGKTMCNPSADMSDIHQAYTETQSINLKMQEWRNSSNQLGMIQMVLSDPSMNYLDFSIEDVELKIIEMEQRMSEIDTDTQKQMIEEEIERAKHVVLLAERYKSSQE